MLFRVGCLFVPTHLMYHSFPELSPWWVCVLRRADIQHCGLAAGTEVQSCVPWLGGLYFQAARGVFGAFCWTSLVDHVCFVNNLIILQVNHKLELFSQLLTIPINITMPFYGDTLHLRFLCFSFDQMSRNLGDLSVHGACGGRDRKWSLWGSLTSRAQEKGLALASDRFTAGTYLLPRHRGPHSRGVLGTWLAQEKSSGRGPSLVSSLLVTCLLPEVSESPSTWD